MSAAVVPSVDVLRRAAAFTAVAPTPPCQTQFIQSGYEAQRLGGDGAERFGGRRAERFGEQ